MYRCSDNNYIMDKDIYMPDQSLVCHRPDVLIVITVVEQDLFIQNNQHIYLGYKQTKNMYF